MVIAVVEGAACVVFGVTVLAEAASDASSPSGRSSAVVIGSLAVLVGLGLTAVGVVLGRGARRTAGAFLVVQVLVALIGLSQAASGLTAGRWAFALAWAGVAAVGAVGLWALARALRPPASTTAADGPGPG